MAEDPPTRSTPKDQVPANLLSDRDVLLAQGPAPTGAGLTEGETVGVVRPDPGSRVAIPAQAGLIYRLEFAAEDALVDVRGDDLTLMFLDRAEIVFQDLVALAGQVGAPRLEVDGAILATDLLLEQLALFSEAAGQDTLPTLETAAGPLQGGGVSRYDDDLGAAIGLLAPEGPIPFTALAFTPLSSGLRLPEDLALPLPEGLPASPAIPPAPPLPPAATPPASGPPPSPPPIAPPSGSLVVNPEGETFPGADPGSGGLFVGALAEDVPAPARLTAAVAGGSGDQVITRIEVANLPLAAEGWTLDLAALQAAVTARGGVLDLSGLADGSLVMTFPTSAGILSFVAEIGLTAPGNSDLDHLGVEVLVTATSLATGGTATGGTQNIAIPVDAIVDGSEVLLNGAIIPGNAVVTGTRGAITPLGLTITNLQDQTSLLGAQPDLDAPFTQGGGDSDGSETVTAIQVTLSDGNPAANPPILEFSLPAGVTVSETSASNQVTYGFTIAPGTPIATVNALVASFGVRHADPTSDQEITVSIRTTTEETALNGSEITTANNRDVDVYGFTIEFPDSNPSAVTDPASVTGALDLNLTFVIDHSSSMQDDSGVRVADVTLPEGITDPAAFLANPENVLPNGNFTRHGLIKVALVELLDTYGTGDARVNVLLIEFDEFAGTVGGGWIEDDLATAINLILGIEAGFGTNYTAAVTETMDAFPIGTPNADQNLLYFLSDGEPTRGGNPDHSIPDQVLDDWEAFLSSELMKAIAVGIGEGVNVADSDLEDVAVPNRVNDGNPLIVLDEDGLIATLVNTAANQVSGNLLVNDDFGPDGPGDPAIVSITVDGTTYVYDGERIVNQSTNMVIPGAVLSLTTLLGGDLIFDFDSGDFSYSAPPVDDEEIEAFTYVIQDIDGDLSSADLVIMIQNQDDPPSAQDDRIVTNSQDIVIADDWLVFNDDDPQGDPLAVAEISNVSGGMATGGFAESTVTFSFSQNDASFDYRAHDFVQTSNAADVELELRAGNDLIGSDGDEILIGSTGDDSLDGRDGDDVLAGSAGDDLLTGGPGDDLLVGGQGEDRLLGEAGEDRFFYQSGDHLAGPDQLDDLDFSDDTIDLSEILEGYDSGDDIDDFVQLDISSDEVRVDADGSENGTDFITLAEIGGAGVNPGDSLTVIVDLAGNGVTVDAS